MTTTSDGQVRVLYIAGFGRSGSTVLDRLLGQDQHFHSGGELDGVWALGPLDDRLCSCGVRFEECPFWRAVSLADPGLLSRENALLMTSYLARILPARAQWRMLNARTRPGLREAQVGDMVQRLNRAVCDVSGRPIIVDSSKHPAYLYLLALQPACDVRVVHLVRDPRAVSYSWGRQTIPDPDGRSSMSNFGDVRASALWLMFNQLTEQVVREFDLPRLLVRYEDLMCEPDCTLRQIRTFAWGEGVGSTTEASAGRVATVDFAPAHIVSGNPMRFQTGPIRLQEDQEWRNDMGAWRKRLVTLITLPRLARYRYPPLSH